MNLLVKGLALEGSIDVRLGVITNKDTVITELYEDWMATRRTIANVYMLSLEERAKKKINLQILQEKADLIEVQLSRLSGTIAAQLKKEQISYTDLQRKLTGRKKQVLILYNTIMSIKGKRQIVLCMQH